MKEKKTIKRILVFLALMLVIVLINSNKIYAFKGKTDYKYDDTVYVSINEYLNNKDIFCLEPDTYIHDLNDYNGHTQYKGTDEPSCRAGIKRQI